MTSLRCAFGLCTCIYIALNGVSLAQEADPDHLLSPGKGAVVGHAYQLSDIQSVNLSNGGLTIRIPLAQLPAGPAGNAGVSLVYNSKYWEDHPYVFAASGSKSVTHHLGASPAGGWRLKYDYELRAYYPEERSGTDPCAPGPAGLVQLLLVEPDGSEHKMYLRDGGAMPDRCEAGTYRVDHHARRQLAQQRLDSLRARWASR